MSNEQHDHYARARSLSEATALIRGDDVCVLAGGTDLVIMRSEGLVRADRIVDIKGIDSLSRIDLGHETIGIGACVKLDHLARDTSFQPNAISDGAALVGSWQTRSRATIGGNICRASPAADTLCGLLVLGGKLELASSVATRTVDAAEFFTGPGKTVKRPDELLTRILLSRNSGQSAYQRFTYRNAMDLAVAGVAVFLQLEDECCVDARVAIGACGPRPILVPAAASALIGSTVDEAAIDAAASAVVAAASPIDDVRGTRKHRLHVLRPLMRRVTRQALGRATGRLS